MDEHECLNLNVTMPAHESLPADLQDAPKLPVMVWIHGGGNVTGAASEWICDPGRLVHRSVELGLPVIVISVKYVLDPVRAVPRNVAGADF
jgi:carboxylesterase type B